MSRERVAGVEATSGRPIRPGAPCDFRERTRVLRLIYSSRAPDAACGSFGIGGGWSRPGSGVGGVCGCAGSGGTIGGCVGTGCGVPGEGAWGRSMRIRLLGRER